MASAWFLNRRANARVWSPRQIWISVDDHHIIYHNYESSFHAFQQGTVIFYDLTKQLPDLTSPRESQIEGHVEVVFPNYGEKIVDVPDMNELSKLAR